MLFVIDYDDQMMYSEIWNITHHYELFFSNSGLILGLRPANERRRYKVTTSLIGLTQSDLLLYPVGTPLTKISLT